jgi:hypothetical protein
MGVLPTDDATQERVRALAQRASKPENWYRPGEAAVPGDNPSFREFVGSYRVVFSFTVRPEDGRTYRHMSMSTLFAGVLPRPEFAFTVAHWLGFTGAVPDKHGLVYKPGALWIIVAQGSDVLVIGEAVE